MIEDPREDVLELKTGVLGQNVSRTAHMDGGAPLERITDSTPKEWTQRTILHMTGGKKAAQKAGTRGSKKASLTDHAQKYELVSNIANAPSGLTFRQPLRGDTVEEKKGISRILATRTKIKVQMVLGTSKDHKKRFLKVVRLKLYGSEAYAMMNYGAIPNLMSKKIEERLCAKTEEATRTIYMATGNKSPVVGMLKTVPVYCAEMAVDSDFLVVDGYPSNSL